MSFAIDPDDGSLTYLNTQSSMGAYPAYNTIDTAGTIVVVSNHASSDAAVQVVDQDGSPEVVKVYDDSTIAIFPVGPQGALGAASDVAVLERTGSLDPTSERSPHAHSVNLDPGDRFALVCDKGANSSIAVFSIEETSGRLTQVDIAPTFGRGPRNINFSPSGRFLFACNFGSNEVHTFEIDPDSGRLTPTGAVASALKPACIKLLAL